MASSRAPSSTPPPPPPATRRLERRSSARVAVGGPAVVSTEQGELEAGIVDLSMGGVSLLLKGTVRRGAFVRVRLPFGSAPDIEPHAVVLRVHPTTEPGYTVIGVSFLGLSQSAVSELSTRVATRA